MAQAKCAGGTMNCCGYASEQPAHHQSNVLHKATSLYRVWQMPLKKQLNYIADDVACYYDGIDTDEIPSLGFRLKCLLYL